MSNKPNKQRFLKVLICFLEGHIINCISAEADADVSICQTAIEMLDNSDVVVHGDDTDLVIILLHLGLNVTISNVNNLILKTKTHEWDIKHVIKLLDADICTNILFIHAFLGCDTTSHILGINKNRFLKLPKNYWIHLAHIFKEDRTLQIVMGAGEKYFLNC